MSEIVRSEEQIRELVAKMREEMDRLPSHNIFGDSNTESKREMAVMIMELEIALEDGRVLDAWSEAGYWLVNEHGTLGSDYGVG